MDGDSGVSESDSKVDRSARPGRGCGVFPVAYPVSSAPAPKKARASGPEVVCLSDSDTSSNALSVATTQSALSGRGTGRAASAEDHRLAVDACRSAPGPFVHRSMAAAATEKPLKQMRDSLHPPNPYVAKRQVRRSECSI